MKRRVEEIHEYSQQEVEKIVADHARGRSAIGASSASVDVSIERGDHGPKDLMDYSPHKPPGIRKITVKLIEE